MEEVEKTPEGQWAEVLRQRSAETDRNLRAALAWLHMTFLEGGPEATFRGEGIQAIAKLIELRTGVNPIAEYEATRRVWFNTGEWSGEL